MFIGAPIVIKKRLKVDHLARMPVSYPTKFANYLDHRAHLGCRGKSSTRVYTSVIVRGEEPCDIRALDWRPGLVVFHLQSQLLISYKEPKRIVPMLDALCCDACISP